MNSHFRNQVGNSKSGLCLFNRPLIAYSSCLDVNSMASFWRYSVMCTLTAAAYFWFWELIYRAGIASWNSALMLDWYAWWYRWDLCIQNLSPLNHISPWVKVDAFCRCTYYICSPWRCWRFVCLCCRSRPAWHPSMVYSNSTQNVALLLWYSFHS